ncbi:unnamed protein product [Owenia fusiformis]|uniref:Antistasin-like domain-containing protein n=1 Tax=Owenia fusiformis TaxID=6347 RepID=A0A8S4PUL9_OWEFU|nr:unnamed protein product [Owenia fusiformis]
MTRPMVPESIVSLKAKVCNPVKCRIYCEFGYSKDDHGCDMCKCKGNPCDFIPPCHAQTQLKIHLEISRHVARSMATLNVPLATVAGNLCDFPSFCCPSTRCQYGDEIYKNGDTFPSLDGCNTCFCMNNGDIGCTEMECPKKGCTHNGKNQVHGEKFPRGDGCNTCTCGNGVVSCTDTDCAHCKRAEIIYQVDEYVENGSCALCHDSKYVEKNIPEEVDTMKVVHTLSLLCAIFGYLLSQSQVMGADHDKDSDHEQEDPFLFGVEGAWPPYSYQDEATGKGIGFLHDAVREVCKVAGKNCGIVYSMSNLENCYNPEKLSGKGLNDRHFGACLGWTATMPRWNVFNFSSPMLDITPAQIYVKSDSGISSVDALEGKTFGFRQFWYMDKFCMRHSGLAIDDEQVKEIFAENGWEDVAKALDDGKVDAVVLPDGHELAREKNLMPLVTAVDCSYGGATGLMHRKDVDTTWFSKALREVKEGFAYSDLCRKWNVQNCCQ